MERITGYAIKVTGGNYAYYRSIHRIGFSDFTFKRREHDIPVGTRVLIYVKGLKAIEDDAVVTGGFADTEGETPYNPDYPNMLKLDFSVLPASSRPVTLARVREILERDTPELATGPYQRRFPRQVDSWRPITREDYTLLYAELLRPSER
ncbi:MAG: hypothetical protein OXF44_02760 [Anaerolineaceae bacterium]|nr:hypothetical protein [Anaerolineaceae bacterium]